MAELPTKSLARFLTKCEPVTESGCWIWTGAARPNGYGNFYMNGKLVGAHVASYAIHVGPVGEGLCVCHTCDTPSCVNPNHLFIGTHKENTADMDAKGRRVSAHQVGDANPMFGRRHSDETKAKQSSAKIGRYANENHPRATINKEIAAGIRAMKGRFTAKQVAAELFVSFHVVRNVWRGKSW